MTTTGSDVTSRQNGRSEPSDFTFASREVIECPYPFYEALRANAPIYKLPGREEYLVSRYEDITYISQHPEIFSNAGAIDTTRKPPEVEGETQQRYTPWTMALSDPPEHKIKRAYGLKMVARDRMRAYDPMIRSIANELIDRFIDRGEAEFVSEFANVLPIYVICEVLGLPRDDYDRILRWSSIEGQASRYLPPERLEGQQALYDETTAYLEEFIVECAKRPRPGFLSELVQLQIDHDGALDLTYLVSEAHVLLVAGNFTTAHMFSSTMMLLLQHPSMQQKAASDFSFIRAMIEESLRLESPVQWLQRLCTEDTQVGGVDIPRGTLLLLLWASGNRDEARFPDAETFLVGRPEVAKRQLAFGHGIHLCLGAPLARLEGVASFETLFTRLKRFRPAVDPAVFETVASIHFRAPREVHMRFDRA